MRFEKHPDTPYIAPREYGRGKYALVTERTVRYGECDVDAQVETGLEADSLIGAVYEAWREHEVPPLHVNVSTHLMWYRFTRSRGYKLLWLARALVVSSAFIYTALVMALVLNAALIADSTWPGLVRGIVLRFMGH